MSGMEKDKTEKWDSKTIQELRGMEGQRVKAFYNEMAQKYQVPWSGRRYNVQNFNGDDLVNKYLSALNHVFMRLRVQLYRC